MPAAPQNAPSKGETISKSLKPLGQVAGDHRRDDHRGGDQGHAQYLRRSEHGDRQQHDEEKIDPAGGYAVGRCDFRIKRGEQQMAGASETARQNTMREITTTIQTSFRVMPRILPNNAASMLRVKLTVSGNDRDAQREARSRHHANGGVGADPAAVADAVNQKRGEQGPEAAAEKKIDVQHVAQHGAAEDCMGKPVADVTHAPQHDVNADKAAESADYDRGE